VYGLDYLLPESAAWLQALRSEVVGHLAGAPDSLLVVEEYDKMDCAARGLWRQLLQHPERANITNNRCVQAGMMRPSWWCARIVAVKME
jgi:hypothetical protein